MRLLVSHVGLGKINNQLRFVELARNPPKSLCFLLLGPLKSPHPDNGFTPFFFSPHLRFLTRIPQNVFQNQQLAPNLEFQLTPLPPSVPPSRCTSNYRKRLNNRASGSPDPKTLPSATDAQHGKGTKVDFCKFAQDCEKGPGIVAAPRRLRFGQALGRGRRAAQPQRSPSPSRRDRRDRTVTERMRYGRCRKVPEGTSRRKVPEGAGPILL